MLTVAIAPILNNDCDAHIPSSCGSPTSSWSFLSTCRPARCAKDPTNCRHAVEEQEDCNSNISPHHLVPLWIRPENGAAHTCVVCCQMSYVATCSKHQVVLRDIWIFREDSTSQSIPSKQEEQTAQRVRQDNHSRRDRFSWIVSG